MSAIIQTKVIQHNSGSFDYQIQNIFIVIPYIRKIKDIQFSNNNYNGKGKVIVTFKSFFKKNNLSFEEHYNDNDLGFKEFPCFSYIDDQNVEHNLIFPNIEIAEKTHKELINNIETFFSQYSDYVSVIK